MEPDDIDTAIESLKDAIAATPHDSPTWPRRVGNLAVLLRRRYLRDGIPADLDAALGAAREVLAVATDETQRAGALTNLAVLLRDRYMRDSTPEDLDETIALLEESVSLTPAGTKERDGRVSNLGSARAERFERTGRLEDLDAAILDLDAAVSSTAPSSRDFAPRLSNLGNALRQRYRSAGDLSDLIRATEAFARAVEVARPESPDFSRLLHNLGNGLVDLFDRTGHAEVLGRALELLRSSIVLTTPGSPERPGRQMSLGIALLARYHSEGNAADLEEAVERLGHAAGGASSANAINRSIAAAWASALQERFRRTRDPEDLDEAIEVCRLALGGSSGPSAGRGACLDAYVASLHARYQRTRNLFDLNEAVDAAEEALSTAPSASSEFSARAGNLGSVLLDRWRSHEGRRDDLDKAIARFEMSIKTSPAESPELPARLSNLAAGLQSLYERDHDVDDLRRGIETYRDSCSQGRRIASPWVADAARNWGRWAAARESWTEAVEACEYELEASMRLFSIQLISSHKEAELLDAKDLHARAAFAYAMTGDMVKAVTTLEHGRARLFSDRLAQDERTFPRLGETDPELFGQLTEAVARIRALERQSPAGPAVESVRWADLRVAHEELKVVLDAVGAIPDYSSMFSPITFDDLVDASAEEPLVYLTVTEQGGLAVIVSSGEVRKPVWLTLVDTKSVRTRILTYLENYYSRHGRFSAWETAVDEITRWTWDVLGQALCEALTSDARAKLIPTGLLGLLPFHAAWTRDPSASHGRRYLIDEILITYAPSARAILRAKSVATNAETDSLLVVDVLADDDERGAGGNPSEIGEAYATFSSRRTFKGDPSKEAVLDALPDYATLHFSCHGVADIADPLKSFLLLAGAESISLEDVLNSRLSVRLAVIASCESAVLGIDLPDEVVSFPTGFIEAGSAAAIGSLWAVPHESTTVLMRRFYDLWRHECVEPAAALRQAQIELRDGLTVQSSETSAPVNLRLSHWAAFAYVGV